MSRYDFTPIQRTAGRDDQPYCWWENWLTDDQLKAIEAYGDALALKMATIGAAKDEPAPEKLRRTKVAWIQYNDQTRWFYDLLAGVVQRINAQFYDLDLTGFVEDFQYGVYQGGSHYDWHVDAGPNTYSPRKLSISVLLTDPKDYQGGDLQIMSGAEPVVCKKDRGTLIAFPSYALHRVTPVTKGIRKSIVAWVAGPPFR